MFWCLVLPGPTYFDRLHVCSLGQTYLDKCRICFGPAHSERVRLCYVAGQCTCTPTLNMSTVGKVWSAGVVILVTCLLSCVQHHCFLLRCLMFTWFFRSSPLRCPRIVMFCSRSSSRQQSELPQVLSKGSASLVGHRTCCRWQGLMTFAVSINVGSCSDIWHSSCMKPCRRVCIHLFEHIYCKLGCSVFMLQQPSQ